MINNNGSRLIGGVRSNQKPGGAFPLICLNRLG